MVLWHKWVEGFSMQSISGVPRQNAHLLQTLPQRQVLYGCGVWANFGSKTFNKSLEGLFAQHVACPSAHVALLGERLETFAKVDGLFRCVVGQNPAQVVHDHICVIVRFKEPVCFTRMMLVDIMESSNGLPVELVTALLSAQAYSGEVWVLLRAHEHHHVAVATPGGPDVARPALQVIRSSHHPTENANRLIQRICHPAVFI